MKFKFRILILSISCLWGGWIFGQSDYLQKEEVALAKMAHTILNSDSINLKFELNKKFIVRFTRLLKKAESYNYPFDSLKTISNLSPEDGSFRIFTWYIVDRPKNTYYGDYAHYYFGLIQRKYIGENGKIHHLVIPLMEMESIPKGIENLVTDNYNWLGALYYQPRGRKNLLSYDGSYYKLVPKAGKVKVKDQKTEQVVTFIPGKYRGRTLTEEKKLSYSNHKRVKENVRYYVLTGWNGWDHQTNYKIVDIMTFDQKDSSKVVFGAPIMYFGKIPKARALFKYSDYAPFSLNMSYVKSGPFKLFRKHMIVYDHMALPKNSRPTAASQMGPDGSYDALYYYKRHGGYFEWYRDVEVAEKYAGKKHRKKIKKLQELHYLDDSLTYSNYNPNSRKAQRKAKKANKREYKRQRKESEQRLKNSGIDLGKGKLDD